MEKRSSLRRKVDISAKYKFVDLSNSSSPARNCKVEDVGLGGLKLVADQSFIVGDRVEIELSLASHKFEGQNNVAKVHLDVVYTYGKQAGCRFYLIHKKNHDEVKEMISKDFTT